LGRNLENLPGYKATRPKKFQPGRLVPVMNMFGSRSDIFVGSRPRIGRDSENILGSDLDRVEIPNTIQNQKYKMTILEHFVEHTVLQNGHFILENTS
jgi:hypothetical protein